MLAIKNLSLYSRKDQRYLVRDFTFTMGEKNRKVALIGEEGNGKSSLLKAIYRTDLVESYLDISGQIDRSNLVMAYLAQESGRGELGLTTEDLIQAEVGWENVDYTEYQRLMTYFSLSNKLVSNQLRLANLSGGEQIKLRLVSQLLKRPDLILLDEPTNNLDLYSIELLEDFILTSPIPIIFISHDQVLLERCSDTIIHLEQILHKTKPVQTVANLNYRDYVEQRQAKLEFQTKLAKKQKEEHDKQMERYRQIYARVQSDLRSVSRQCPNVAKNLKDKMRSVKSMGKRFARQEENMVKKPITEDAIELSFNHNSLVHQKKKILEYQAPILQVGDRVLSRDIELTLIGPEKVGIVGPNGCGKTSLVRKLQQELEKNKLNIAYMPQNYWETMDFKLSPVEYLTKDYTKEEETRIRTYLGSLNFTPEEMLRPISSLSGGQKAKLFFCEMVLGQVDFMILDEPTRNLSPLSGPEIRQSLKDFTGGIIVVSHDRSLLNEVCDRVYQLTPHGLTELDWNSEEKA